MEVDLNKIKFRALTLWWKKRFKYFVSKLDKHTKENWGIIQDSKEIINFIFSYKNYPETNKIIGTFKGEIICFAQITPISTKIANIEGVVVRTDLQGKGIGTKLMCYLETIARNQKIKKIALEVFVINKRGIKFYKKLGYKKRFSFKTESIYFFMVKKIES